ncbi:non-ribosomal peptide synthetase [Pseudonocardia sp. ICBG1142]|uniref:non-ribosomal peptide synthetase n=1 Tax=Pseudonocardia sp. ICBG1142 TaxID=2846760 RepID=UPI001CF69737|nr:non-ribosomal peptide synthetase [Pseudonocardia sp. ICBG1142]
MQSGDAVAVAVPRGVDLLPALLGVQLSGAAYVPLDPDHPADRLGHLVADSGARVLVTTDGTVCRGLAVDLRVHVQDVVAVDAATTVDQDSAAYVIYTSGSTGRPKGVVVDHRAFSTFLTSMRDQLRLPEPVLLPAVTTVSFDIAGLELFLPLVTGGRVVVARPEEVNDPHRLADLLTACHARALQATPATWRLLLDAGWMPGPGFTVLCGGERLPTDLAERLLGDGAALWDLYGPTETTVWSSLTRHQLGAPTRFAPVDGTSLHVLDDALRPVLAEEVGELYIGGAGLAVGYHRRAGLTSMRFVADPTSPHGGRLYRTGDLARSSPDGRIRILGRCDDQVKIRGFRIEPGEIEHALVGVPGVAEAVVTSVRSPEGSTSLDGHIRPVDVSRPPDADRLRSSLSRVLPGYMIPARFLVHDTFPRTPNGKLDRAALATSGRPAVGAHQPATTDALSDDDAGPTARLIASVLADVLGRDTVGVHEDFFAMGGDSLRAVQIVLRLNEQLATEVPINSLFEVRTVYGLARILDSGADATPMPSPAAGDEARLSAAQWRLWLRHRADPENTADGSAVVVRLPGPFDRAALDTALDGLFRRHPMLCTRYEADAAGLPVAAVGPPPGPPPLETADPESVLAAELARPFDLAHEPPVRLRLVRPTPCAAPFLLAVVHQIAADERSRALVTSQLRATYRGRAVVSPALSYNDYATWERDRSASAGAARHREFWRTTLSGPPPADLPLDRPRREVRDSRCAVVRFSVSPPAIRAVRDAAGGDQPTGALTTVVSGLSRWIDSTTVNLGVAVDGRDHPSLDDVVGMIEQTAVLRLDLGERPTFTQLARQVRARRDAATEHAVLPFEDMVASTEIEPTSSSGRHPLFDVFVALHGAPADPPGFVVPFPPHTHFDVHPPHPAHR